MPEISVIVPAYKVEAFLGRCVDSILSQSFADWELILVDDGSPDRSGQICDEYAQKDSRIHVIHQKNAGLSAARNAATDWVFANSGSQWITYVDGDDWLHPNALECLLAEAKRLKVKISTCAYVRTSGEMPAVPPQQMQAVLWSAQDFYTKDFINATVACAKLYHKSCLEAVRYPVGKLHEDEFVTYRLLFEAEYVAVIPGALYAYYINPESITRSRWSPRRLDAWDAYEEQIAFFERRGNRDMVSFRYRDYLENGRDFLDAAGTMEDPAERSRVVKAMGKRLRGVIVRGCRGGYLDLRKDGRLFFGAMPLRAKLYWVKKKVLG